MCFTACTDWTFVGSLSLLDRFSTLSRLLPVLPTLLRPLVLSSVNRIFFYKSCSVSARYISVQISYLTTFIFLKLFPAMFLPTNVSVKTYPSDVIWSYSSIVSNYGIASIMFLIFLAASDRRVPLLVTSNKTSSQIFTSFWPPTDFDVYLQCGLYCCSIFQSSHVSFA